MSKLEITKDEVLSISQFLWLLDYPATAGGLLVVGDWDRVWDRVWGRGWGRRTSDVGRWIKRHLFACMRIGCLGYLLIMMDTPGLNISEVLPVSA